MKPMQILNYPDIACNIFLLLNYNIAGSNSIVYVIEKNTSNIYLRLKYLGAINYLL